MGSEGPSSVSVYMTGFKKFHGVAENPTETIVTNLKEFMQKKGLPKGVILESCDVLDTAGQGAVAPLYKFFESSLAGQDDQTSNMRRVVLLHLGVNSCSTGFAIECQAINEASFRCPDELGWKPHRVPIVEEDEDITTIRQTTLPAYEIAKQLVRKGYEVVLSNDAGRFVCNYVYYNSLRFAEEHGIKSLFVHVPLFTTIDEETQMQFIASLLEAIAALNN